MSGRSKHSRWSGGSPRGIGIWAVTVLAAALLAGPLPLAAQSPGASAEAGEWVNISGDASGTRYSPLDQIDAANFEDLEVAWTWSAESFGPPNTARATPLYVDGKLITVAGPRRTVVALDASTGATLWSFREPDTARWEYSMRKNHGKGVAYAELDGRGVIYVVTPAFFLHALDAETGRPLEGFGSPVPIDGFPETGTIDLLGDLGHDYDPYDGIAPEEGYITSSSPPIVVNGVLVVGNSAEQGYNQSRNENVPGDILAYDARTGEHLWKFNVIPRPGEFGHETWHNDAWEWTGDVSSWAPMSADPELGLVYIPTNGPTNDFYSGFRPGENLFGTSIIALDVETGEREWHYQLVKNDLWNYDTPVAPVLLDVTVDGEPTPVLAQATKQAFLYVFNRETGEPVWPFEEREVPESDVPGEWTSPTQPFPTRPEAYDLQGISEDDLIDFTPELREQAIDNLSHVRMGPLFTPPLHRDNDLGYMSGIWCPGSGGGSNIPGPSAADPETGIIYVTSQKGCTAQVIVPGEERDATVEDPTGQTIADYTAMGSAGATGPQGLPYYKPPYSRITAIDLNTGEHLWWIPVGDTPENIDSHPALEEVDLPNTGTGNLAAQLVTPNLLLYTGEGTDGTPYLYAVDKTTGDRLGSVEIPAPGRYGLSGFMHDGQQHVIVQMSGMLAALRLP